MSPRPLVVLALAAAACGPAGPTSGACADAILPGDLVITEIFADAAAPPGSSGTDDGQEWFEVYNASSRRLDLAGISLVHSRGDGGMRREVRLPALTIDAGQYLVFGNTIADLAPAWVDYGYANKLGALYNSGTGTLALACGDTEIDAAVYESVKAGESRQLDGGRAPDYLDNDDLALWCPAKRVAANEYTPANFGTPGRPNDPCDITVAGMCKDGDELRPIVRPEPGDLAITELMPNPAAVGDTVGEWFEVIAHRDVDLNGIVLDRLSDSMPGNVVDAEACLRVTAGSFAVFARSADPGVNGGLPRVDGTFKFAMLSGSAANPGDVAIFAGGVLIDAVTWTSSRAGRSRQLDPSYANAEDNDDPAYWCDGTQPYGEGDLGTPGEPNAPCGGALPPGTCIDGTSTRVAVAPDVGDLLITEVMPSPDAVSDARGEWFEVLATRDVDLNGLGLDRASDNANPNVVTASACLRLAAGERAVFARSSDPALNGGLPPVTAGFSFSLITGSPASPGDVRILYGETVLDAVTWTRSTRGAARQLDPAIDDPDANDVETSWCNATVAYGDGDLGTPGAANTPCEAMPQPTLCLDGGVARDTVGPEVGDLILTEVMPNPAAVSDAVGEWFEVLVTRDVDLNGVGLDRAGDSLAPTLLLSADCLRVTAGSYLVFAKSANPDDNGGIPVPITATFGFALVDGTPANPGDVRLLFGGEVLDAITWTSTRVGRSHQLDPGKLDPIANDDASSFCDGSTPYGDGDLGTPGAANLACPLAVPPGMCADGEAVRPIVKPVAGALVITEVMANPAGTETTREWFEITNTGADAFDVNGLGLDREGDTRAPDLVAGTTCKSVAPGGFALFARSADPASNAGLPAVDGTFGFAMPNTAGDVRVLDGDVVLDAITYGNVSAAMFDGASLALDPGSTTVTANDAPAPGAPWCLGTTPYGDETNKGTPRAANPACP